MLSRAVQRDEVPSSVEQCSAETGPIRIVVLAYASVVKAEKGLKCLECFLSQQQNEEADLAPFICY